MTMIHSNFKKRTNSFNEMRSDMQSMKRILKELSEQPVSIDQRNALKFVIKNYDNPQVHVSSFIKLGELFQNDLSILKPILEMANLGKKYSDDEIMDTYFKSLLSDTIEKMNPKEEPQGSGNGSIFKSCNLV